MGTGGLTKSAWAFPRYYLVQKERDVLVLDVLADRYYWRGNTIADISSPRGQHAEDGGAIDLKLQLPTADGAAPRGPDRLWRFELRLVIEAIALLNSSCSMAAKGFSGFAVPLNAELTAPLLKRYRHISFAQIAAAMEWARLLIPRRAKCLEIAIATTRLARRHGIDARLVVGVQALPIQAHAWAEVGGALINDFLDRVNVFRPIFSLPCSVQK